MERFARFDPESVERWLRAAQASTDESAGDMVCPRCNQSFLRSEITKTRGPSRYVGYEITCPKCGVSSPFSRFGYPRDRSLDQPKGRGQHVWNPDRMLDQMGVPRGPAAQQQPEVSHQSGPWKDDWSTRPTIGRSQS